MASETTDLEQGIEEHCNYLCGFLETEELSRDQIHTVFWHVNRIIAAVREHERELCRTGQTYTPPTGIDALNIRDGYIVSLKEPENG